MFRLVKTTKIAKEKGIVTIREFEDDGRFKDEVRIVTCGRKKYITVTPRREYCELVGHGAARRQVKHTVTDTECLAYGKQTADRIREKFL